MYVLTKSNNVTSFHIDPSYGSHGFMYLSEGEKIWYFIHKDYVEHLIQNNINIEEIK